jgi:hypothetical protein
MTKPKAVQIEIPGTEQKKNAAIEKAADQYAETRDERMALSKDEANKKAKLKEMMRLHIEARPDAEGNLVRTYERGDYKITMSTSEDVKVKIYGDEPPADDVTVE